jgi:DNA mismatch repair ATPase MutS
MKAFLLYKDHDFDLDRELPASAQALTQDLGLQILFEAMARDDSFLFEVAEQVVLTSLVEPDEITYRQHVLQDCFEHPDLVRQIYDIAVGAIIGEKHLYGGFLGFRTPDTILHRAVEAVQFFVGELKKLRAIADENRSDFASEGFNTFFETLQKELDDGYFDTIEEHLKRLRFRGGVWISAELGDGNKGENYTLRTPRIIKRTLFEQISGRNRPTSYTVRIADRDEAGANALGELRSRGINLVANALAQSGDHILSFFQMLRTELGFYVGCLQLHERLTGNGGPASFPEPLPAAGSMMSFRGLYDACLSLSADTKLVGNDVDADGKSLVMITGANQGGKSTFLRSVGLAHLMMQSGMFVAADSFRASACSGLFTHYKREEDSSMESGKLDEELVRMSEIADDVKANGIVLFNESFAATNEREGSEIARQIIRALRESGVRVCFVTHFFDLASGFYHQQHDDDTLFLRAERRPDGRRTFKLVVGEPLPTSYGEDLYERVFGTENPAEITERRA